jgi:hypothetical protein
MSKILMGVWDCPACGTKGIRGDVYACPNCGRVRADDVRFYLPKDAVEVTDAAGIAAAKAGADWRCDYCGNLNAAASGSCEKCGAPRGSKERATHKYDQTAIPRSAAEAAGAPREPASVPTAPPKRRSWTLPAVGVVILAALVGLGIFLFTPRASVATVSGKSWERSLRVEAYGPQQEQDWDESVPSDAYGQQCRTAVRSYVQVQTGTRTEQQQECQSVAVGEETYECGVVDLGNGRFEQQMCTRTIYEDQCEWVSVEVPVYVDEPVYDNYCTYTVDRWAYARTETASERDTEPYWPAVAYAANEREEEGSRQEKYVVYIVDNKEKTWEWEPDLATWQQFSRGQEVILKTTRMNKIVSVEAK